jgi:hypothetical protein
MLPCPAVTITRREAIGWLGFGAAGIAGKIGDTLAAQPARPSFPQNAIIRTILRDLPPAELASGPSLFREHPSMRYR